MRSTKQPTKQPTLLVLVGDTHVKKDDIAEMSLFIDWLIKGVNQLQKTHEVMLIFLGDQHNDFGIAKVEVQAFWKKAYSALADANIVSASLVGNHDENQQGTENFMVVHDTQTSVVGKDLFPITPTIAATGFFRKEEMFRATAMKAYDLGVRTLICHAEFNGCQYENGFYAPHGFDLPTYPPDLKFISGHIHMKQSFGNVFYPGTPRHLTRSDIGEVKGIHTINTTSGQVDFIPTPADICIPFQSIQIKESNFNLADIKNIPDSNKIYIEIQGSKEFSKKISKSLPDLAHKRSVYSEDVKEVKIKESEGIPKSFDRFTKEFWINNPVSNETKMAILEKIFTECPSLKLGLK